MFDFIIASDIGYKLIYIRYQPLLQYEILILILCNLFLNVAECEELYVS